jgi:UDP-N-acetylmuramyl pentapeptide phosphotransferase/UDP-N-acetylglucosamine-1-phosphate transferase
MAMAELIFFIEACCISYLLTGAILRFSLKRRLLDIPNDRSSHSIPKPRLGGVAITLSFYLTTATLLIVGFKPFASSAILVGAFGGGAMIALAGFIDDLHGLGAKFKLIVQFGAAGIAVASGLVLHEMRIPLIGELSFGPLAVPVTLLWIVAIINFYNFIDGIDGLAAGIGMIASAFLYFLSGMAGAVGIQNLYAVLAGSLFGFLRFNFPPSRIFMGDMGSTFIGFTFAVLSIVGEGFGVPAFITILLLVGVVGDAALTLIRRALRGEKILSPHRTHYYQRLTSLGLSHKQVTLLEYLIAVLLGVSAILAFHQEWTFVTFLSVVWIGFFLWALAKIRSMEKGNRLLWQGRTLGVAFGDLAFIALSYILSYYLRLNFKFPPVEAAVMLTSLPIVLVIRTAVFFSYGLYRGVWRYTTFDDIIRIAKAVSIGSAIMVVSFTLLFRFKAFPRSVFIIDWFILAVFMAGSRIAARWFHELPSREELPAKRVIIAGAGAIAELVLQRVKKVGELRAIGYVDDRTEMTGHIIHGLKVLGPLSKIAEIAEKHRADEVIVISSFFDRIPKESRDRLDAAGILIRAVSDPSEISAPRADLLTEPPCAGRSVLVAGNGPLVEAAGAVFSRSSRLTVISNERRPFEQRGGFAEGGAAEEKCYLGMLDDRPALHRIFEIENPDIVFADFTLRGTNLDNAVEAYVRTVLLPLERIASEVLRRSPSRLLVIARSAEPASPEGARAAELLLLSMFRHDPKRLSILKVEYEPSPGEWREVVSKLVDYAGGGYLTLSGESERKACSMSAVTVEGTVPEIGSLYLELTRSLDEGDSSGVVEALRALSRMSPLPSPASDAARSAKGSEGIAS